MKGKVQLLFIALVAYLLGCVFRHKRCQREWRDRHPYSYTGRESTPGPGVISSMKPREPDMDIGKTTPVLQKPTQVVRKKDPVLKETSEESASTGYYSIPEKDSTTSPEKRFPAHKHSDPVVEKTTNTIPAIPKDWTHNRPTKTTSTTASKITKTESRKKDLTTPFPDDPIAGFNAFGIEWRRDQGPGKMFAGFTNQFKKDSTPVTTEPKTSVPTSSRGSENRSEVDSSGWLSRVFGSNEMAETAQPSASVSSSASIFTSEPKTTSGVKSPGWLSRIFGSNEMVETPQRTASVLSSASSSTSEPKTSSGVKSPGWWFQNFGNSETAKTSQPTASASVMVSGAKSTESPEITEYPNWLPWLFGSKEKTAATQPLVSKSTFTTTSMTQVLKPKEIIQSATSLLKSKTTKTTAPPSSHPDVDQSSVGFFGGIIDWVTGKANPTEDSNGASRLEPLGRQGCGFGGLSKGSTEPSSTQSELSTSGRWYDYFRRDSDSAQSTTSSTATPGDLPATTARGNVADKITDEKSKPKSKSTKSFLKPTSTAKLDDFGPTPRAKTDLFVGTKPSSESKASKRSKSSADRKPVTGLSPSTERQEATGHKPTVEAIPTKEWKSFGKPESKQPPPHHTNEYLRNEIPTKRSRISEWFLGTWTKTIHIPWPAFGIREPDNDQPTLRQE